VGAATPAAPTSLPQPVKVVTIQLSPAELGTLTVRISLRNDALELQVEASRRETAQMVDADRETLSSLLRSAGYHVDAVTVRAVEQPMPPMASGTATGSPDGAPQSQSQSSGSQADQRSAGGRAHADAHRQGHGTRHDGSGNEDGVGPRAGRGLYV
jgi:chemotaxis protein MotD